MLYTDATKLDSLQIPAIPLLVHASGKAPRKLVRSASKLEYDYAEQQAHFASPFTKDFHYAAEAVSHTRNLTHLKKLMNGPYFDLEAYWDEHTYYEFEVRDVEATMCTMVQEPYVNHVPTVCLLAAISNAGTLDEPADLPTAHRRHWSQSSNRLLSEPFCVQQSRRHSTRAHQSNCWYRPCR